MIGIVFLLNTTFAPFMNKYTDILKQEHEEFEIIYWDRLGISDENNEVKSHVFSLKSDLKKSYFSKAKDFIKFRSFLIKTLRKQKYDKLIILTTLSGMLITDFLLKKYKGKYIFDIRDYSFEKIGIFKYFEKKLIDHSYFTSISSEGFKKFLPASDKYIVSHNILRNEIKEARDFKLREFNKNRKINLVFIGSVRFFDLDVKIAEKLSSDKRFSLVYHGYGPTYDKFKSYCNQNNFNITFTGRYDRKSKIKFCESADIFNAYYDEANVQNQYLLPNKLYDTLIYRIPLWVNPKVYAGKLANQFGVGLCVDLNKEDFADSLYNQFCDINRKVFDKSCDKALMNILNQDNIFISKVKDFIKERKTTNE